MIFVDEVSQEIRRVLFEAERVAKWLSLPLIKYNYPEEGEIRSEMGSLPDSYSAEIRVTGCRGNSGFKCHDNDGKTFLDVGELFIICWLVISSLIELIIIG